MMHMPAALLVATVHFIDIVVETEFALIDIVVALLDPQATKQPEPTFCQCLLGVGSAAQGTWAQLSLGSYFGWAHLTALSSSFVASGLFLALGCRLYFVGTRRFRSPVPNSVVAANYWVTSAGRILTAHLLLRAVSLGMTPLYG